MSTDLTGFEQYLYEADRSPSTVRSYLADMHAFVCWFEQTNSEPLAPAAITPSDARAYKQHLLGRKLKPATINRRLASLKAYVHWAIEAGQIESDPTAKIQPVEQVRLGPRWLDRKQLFALQREVERALQQAGTQPERRRAVWAGRDAVLLNVLCNTGLRVAEAAGLDVADVELKARSGQLTVNGKGTKIREVPLNAEARELLERWLKIRPACETPAVFPSQFLQRMTPRSIERVVAEYGRRAKIDNLTPHQLRHSFAKTLVDRGVPIDRVGQLLGHSSVNTTSRYTTPNQQDLAVAVEVLLDR